MEFFEGWSTNQAKNDKIMQSGPRGYKSRCLGPKGLPSEIESLFLKGNIGEEPIQLELHKPHDHASC